MPTCVRKCIRLKEKVRKQERLREMDTGTWRERLVLVCPFVLKGNGVSGSVLLAIER